MIIDANNRAATRDITLVSLDAAWLAVQEGLLAGDLVIVAPTTVTDGQLVHQEDRP